MAEEKESYCRVNEKGLKAYIYAKNDRIAVLEKALKKILQKFQEPQYNGDPRQYETIDEIAERALYGRCSE